MGVHQEMRGPQAGPLSAQACRRLACKNDGVWREGPGSSHPAPRRSRSKDALEGWGGGGEGRGRCAGFEAHGLQERDGTCGSGVGEEPAEQGGCSPAAGGYLGCSSRSGQGSWSQVDGNREGRQGGGIPSASSLPAKEDTRAERLRGRAAALPSGATECMWPHILPLGQLPPPAAVKCT